MSEDPVVSRFRISARMLRQSCPASGVAYFSGVFFFIAISASAIAQLSFEDVTDRSGLAFEHFSGRSQEHFLYETVSTGAATLDYNNDGLIDIYLPNGNLLANPDVRWTNRLYRNEGGMRFTDVTLESGAGDVGFALGVTSGDYDNDGDQDLIVSNFGPTVLLENLGDGTFVRRVIASGREPRLGAGVAFLDADGDGNSDLFVANYVQFDPNKNVNREIFGVPAAPGPKDYLPDTDCLYANLGDGRFEDVSQESGIDAFAGPGMGVVAYDFDGDRDTDIFVCNDSAANHLYENLGNWEFDEIALLAGLAYDVSGEKQASMGADVGDFDRDGLLDLVATNFSNEIPNVYRYSGDGYFDDIGPAVGLGVLDQRLTWGVAFGDFNNDAQLDLFVASGHLFDIVKGLNQNFAMPNAILLQEKGKLIDWSDSILAVSGNPRVSRAVCVEDFDNDGDLDVLCLNSDDQAQLLCNTSETNGNYVQFNLVGTHANRDAIGSRVVVKDSGGAEQTAVVVSGRGYQSHFGTRLHFGLGSMEGDVSVSVEWHGGETQEFSGLASSSRWTLIQGRPQAFADGTLAE